MDILLVTNANAGTNEDQTVAQVVAALESGASVDVRETSSPDELDEVMADAPGKRIVVLGGDGSLHAVVAAVHRNRLHQEVEIALVPLGTGNDFARGTEIPLDPGAAAALALSGEARDVDLITDDSGGIVINNVHAGASAQASRQGAKWKARLGRFGLSKLGYPVGAAIAAIRPPFVRVTLWIDGHRVLNRRKVLMISLGNSAYVGGGTPLTPDAEVEDGKIDVMISRAVGPLARFGFTWHLRKGEHQERDDVNRLRGREVTLSGERFWTSADGEIEGPITQRTWTLHPGALRMVLPGQAPGSAE